MGIIKLPSDSIEFFKSNLDDILTNGNLAEGKWNDEVANWAKLYTAARHTSVFNSNGSGLVAILQILKRYFNKKHIFLQSNTMYGVRTISISSGLTLVGFVGSSLDYLMPKFEQVEDFVACLDNPSECVFLITHIGGWVNPDIEKIAEFCKEKKISLVEDCAHSLGATLNGKHTGLFGDAGAYSLYSTKAIPVGEGGISVTNNDELGERLEKYRIYDRFNRQQDVGINVRMSEVNALLAYSVLLKTEEIIQNKITIGEKYIKACDEVNLDYIKPFDGGQRTNHYKFILRSDDQKQLTQMAKIKKRTSGVYDYSLSQNNAQIDKKHICLPIWYKLEEKIVNEIINEVRSV